jgi:hypothetical protein
MQGVQISWLDGERDAVEQALIYVDTEHARLELRQPGAGSGQPVEGLAAALGSLARRAAKEVQQPAKAKIRPAMYNLHADDGGACAAAPGPTTQPPAAPGPAQPTAAPSPVQPPAAPDTDAPEGEAAAAVAREVPSETVAAVARLAPSAGEDAQRASLAQLQAAALAGSDGWADEWCRLGALEVRSWPRSKLPSHSAERLSRCGRRPAA